MPMGGAMTPLLFLDTSYGPAQTMVVYLFHFIGNVDTVLSFRGDPKIKNLFDKIFFEIILKLAEIRLLFLRGMEGRG